VNKDYAEYRLNHFRAHFNGIEFNDRKEILTTHFEEDSGGKLQRTTNWTFSLRMSLANAPGVGFAAVSRPFELIAMTKENLDGLFLDTLFRLLESVHKNIELNIHEG
jgi:hypothetical protein